jgi:hypothetical protein
MISKYASGTDSAAAKATALSQLIGAAKAVKEHVGVPVWTGVKSIVSPTQALAHATEHGPAAMKTLLQMGGAAAVPMGATIGAWELGKHMLGGGGHDDHHAVYASIRDDAEKTVLASYALLQKEAMDLTPAEHAFSADTSRGRIRDLLAQQEAATAYRQKNPILGRLWDNPVDRYLTEHALRSAKHHISEHEAGRNVLNPFAGYFGPPSGLGRNGGQAPAAPAEMPVATKQAFSLTSAGHAYDAAMARNEIERLRDTEQALRNYDAANPAMGRSTADIEKYNRDIESQARHLSYVAKRHGQGRNAYNPFGGRMAPSSLAESGFFSPHGQGPMLPKQAGIVSGGMNALRGVGSAISEGYKSFKAVPALAEGAKRVAGQGHLSQAWKGFQEAGGAAHLKNIGLGAATVGGTAYAAGRGLRAAGVGGQQPQQPAQYQMR